MKLPMLEVDTANHAIYGAAVAIAALAVANWFGLPHAALLGAGAAALFGAGKEAADYLSRRASIKAGERPTHGIEWTDMAGTVAGGLAVAAAHLVR